MHVLSAICIYSYCFSFCYISLRDTAVRWGPFISYSNSYFTHPVDPSTYLKYEADYWRFLQYRRTLWQKTGKMYSFSISFLWCYWCSRNISFFPTTYLPLSGQCCSSFLNVMSVLGIVLIDDDLFGWIYHLSVFQVKGKKLPWRIIIQTVALSRIPASKIWLSGVIPALIGPSDFSTDFFDE